MEQTKTDSRELPSPISDSRRRYTPEQVEAYLRRDVQHYLDCCHKAGRLDDYFAFYRTLCRGELSSFLLETQGCSYAEYLLAEGVLRETSPGIWCNALHEYLLAAFDEQLPQAPGSFFTWDSSQGRCRIQTPLYDGAMRVSATQASERCGATLRLQPCWRDASHSPDTLLQSGNTVVGSLSRTVFVAQGVGTVLMPALCTGAVSVRRIRMSGAELPLVNLELILEEQ